jgi:hypothetical protein
MLSLLLLEHVYKKWRQGDGAFSGFGFGGRFHMPMPVNGIDGRQDHHHSTLQIQRTPPVGEQFSPSHARDNCHGEENFQAMFFRLFQQESRLLNRYRCSFPTRYSSLLILTTN